MAISSCSKEVATRLFQMLAVNEMEADAVKSDHASYAKLGLLTQQANMLQRQAVQVVNKSASQMLEGKAAEPELTTECTALSTEYTDGAQRLLGVLAVNDNAVAAIKRDQAACAKLSLLADQVGLLQEQAKQVVDEAELNRRLTEISKSQVCRLVPGTMYYHYTQNGKEALSRVAADEWNSYDAFHGKYLYDFDFAFRKLEEGEPTLETECALLPCAMGTPKTPAGLFTDGDMGTPAGGPEIARDHKGAPAPMPTCHVLSRW